MRLLLHPALAANALPLIRSSKLERVVVTNTILVPPEAWASKIEVIDVSWLLAEAIERIHEDRSVSELFSALRPELPRLGTGC